MATSQMNAAANSGSNMSDFGNDVRPALKLMKVLTTATEASDMPTAAGIPSSLTRPDVWRMNNLPGSPLDSRALTSLLAITDLLLSITNGAMNARRARHNGLGSDLRLSIPTYILRTQRRV